MEELRMPDLSWIPLEEMRNEYEGVFGRGHYAQLCFLRPIVQRLHETYEDGNQWLSTPLDQKEEIRHSHPDYHVNELSYIVPWAWYAGLCHESGSEAQWRRETYVAYLRRRRRQGLKVAVKWAQYFGLLSEEELTTTDKLLAQSGGSAEFRTSLSIHTLILAKPFRQFTDDDLDWVSTIWDNHVYSKKTLQDFRILMGYSQTRLSMAFPNAWETLKATPALKEMATRYHQYLKSADAHPGSLKFIPHVLQRLFEFAEQCGFEDLSRFGRKEFLQFQDWLDNGRRAKKSLATYISIIKTFFEWGCGEPGFPSELDVPFEEWRRLAREANRELNGREGHSFASRDAALQLVEALHSFVPSNEREQLYQLFWMVACSAPPRFRFLLDLDVETALRPMPNEPSAWGLCSPSEDKAGHTWGQFPILDPMGLTAIRALIERAKELKLPRLYNPRTQRAYVHLFQLSRPPSVPSETDIRVFLTRLKHNIVYREPDGRLAKGSAHAFRTLLLAEIAARTRSLGAVQLAAGHRNEQMTRLYLRSRIARNALLYKVVAQYEGGQITGRFYLRLISLLTDDETPVDAMMRALATDMELETFLAKYGKRLDMGHCLNQSECDNWMRCWGCHHFLMQKEETQEAVATLIKHVVNMREMVQSSRDFTYDNSIAAGQMKVIALIVKRLNDLGLTEDKLEEMVMSSIQQFDTAHPRNEG